MRLFLIVFLAFILNATNINVHAEPSQSPLRIRVNKILILNHIKNRDQELLKDFKDIEITEAL